MFVVWNCLGPLFAVQCGYKMIPSFELAAMSQTADDSNSSTPSLDDLIPLREAAKLSGLSAGHLRLLVSRGDMWGTKLGRNWVTTTQAVQEYLAQDRRPGPKPKEPRDKSSI